MYNYIIALCVSICNSIINCICAYLYVFKFFANLSTNFSTTYCTDKIYNAALTAQDLLDSESVTTSEECTEAILSITELTQLAY